MKIPKNRIWLEEGYPEVIEYGFDGFNVDQLSDKIKIAKTSFYHFFNSREEYLEALVKFWAGEQLDQVILSLKRAQKEANEKAYIFHKRKYASFYCFMVLARRYGSQNHSVEELVEEVERKIRNTTDDFISAYLGNHNIDANIRSFIHTFLSGWDYLYIFDVYRSKNTNSASIEELDSFLKRLKLNTSILQKAS